MNNIHIIEYLDFYISTNKPQFAVMLTGKWGSGKTYFIKQLVEVWESKKTKTAKDEIILKPVYISLYGASSPADINQRIKEILNPLLYSKGMKITKNIISGLIKTAAHINIDINSDGTPDGKVSFDISSLGLLKDDNSKVKGNKILIFDDLERCKIDTVDLFGYFNEFVEHSHCKVILLCDESKLNLGKKKLDLSYKDFKEKLIGQTFAITANVDDAINSFLKIVTNPSRESELLKQSTRIIKDVFVASRVENLRILKQAILDFERFTTYFIPQIKGHEAYSDFLKSLFAHFLLVYLEYKSGNIKVEDFDAFTLKDDEDKQIIKNTYYPTLKKNEIYYQSPISYGHIVDFIKTGTIDKDVLNGLLCNNNFFRDTQEQDWEKLWRWEDLEQDDFDRLYKSVSSDFDNRQFTVIEVLAHVVAIFYSLIDNKIIKRDKRLIYESYKNQFDNIIKNRDSYMIFISDFYWSREYRGSKSKSFLTLRDYSNKKIEQHNSLVGASYLSDFFESMDNTAVYGMDEYLRKPTPDRNRTYKDTPIFASVNGKKMGKCIASLNNHATREFFQFIEVRYSPEKVYTNGHLEIYHARDKQCLLDMSKFLKGKMNAFSEIKKYNYKSYIKLLTEIILKLDNLDSKK